MDTKKGGICRGRGRGRGGRGHYRSKIFYSNISTNITSTDIDKKGIKFSPQMQCNQLISYANLRDDVYATHKRAMHWGGQYVTKSIKDMIKIYSDSG